MVAPWQSAPSFWCLALLEGLPRYLKGAARVNTFNCLGGRFNIFCLHGQPGGGDHARLADPSSSPWRCSLGFFSADPRQVDG